MLATYLSLVISCQFCYFTKCKQQRTLRVEHKMVSIKLSDIQGGRDNCSPRIIMKWIHYNSTCPLQIRQSCMCSFFNELIYMLWYSLLFINMESDFGNKMKTKVEVDYQEGGIYLQFFQLLCVAGTTGGVHNKGDERLIPCNYTFPSHHSRQSRE